MDSDHLNEILDGFAAAEHFHFVCIYTLILDQMDSRRADGTEKAWVDKYLKRVGELIDAHETNLSSSDTYLNVKIHELSRSRLDMLSSLLKS
jgi:hypothetical protein